MANSLLADAFAHHVWATESVIDACLALDAQQLEAPVNGVFGSIVDTARHLVGADSWYLFSITSGSHPAVEADHLGLEELRSVIGGDGLAWQELLAKSPDPETVIKRRRADGSEEHAPLGIRFAQALHHGTDHRSQICTALTLLGVEPPDIDVWSYAWSAGTLVEIPPEAKT